MDLKSQFLLDPEITYLNHGSFGACPKPVFDAYQSCQLKLERQPVNFILTESQVHLQAAKESLGAFVDCDPGDFFFTVNPTFAINAVMRSLKLNPGDEILSTDQEYGAMDRTWSFFGKQSGVKQVRQKVTLPIRSKEEFLNEFWQGYSENTKAVFINQISSATALIFPVKEIIVRAKELGLMAIIDGAHVPGHIDLSLRDLDPDFYTGTLHKWMLSPKGSSFLYVSKEFQSVLDPFIVGWGYESTAPGPSQFLDYHEQQGTRDISAFLATPAAVRFLEDNNWKQKAAVCRDLVKKNYARFCALLKTEPLCPITDEFIGQMCSMEIQTSKPGELKALLYNKYRIEIPVMPHNDKIFLRYSIQVYNTQEDLDKLYKALEDIISSTDLLEL